MGELVRTDKQMSFGDYISYKESQPDYVPIEASDKPEYTMTDLRNDPYLQNEGVELLDAIQNSDKFIAKEFSNLGILENTRYGQIYGKWKAEQPKDSDDVVTFLRKQNVSLLNPFATAHIVKDLSPRHREIHATLMQKFEKAELEGLSEWVDAVMSNVGHMANDPINYIGFGLGMLGKNAVMAAAKSSGNPKFIQLAERYFAEGWKATGMRTAPAGAAWGISGDAGQQSMALANELQDEWRWGDTAISGGGGAILGWSLGAGASKVMEKFLKEPTDGYNKIVDEEIVEDNLQAEIGVSERPTLSKEEVEPEQMVLPLYSVIEEFVEEATPKIDIPVGENIPQVSKYETNRAKVEAKKTKLEEKEERLYGGFVPESEIQKIADEYNMSKEDIVEEMLEYEASRDFPSWETTAEAAYSPLYAERSFRYKAMKNFQIWKENKKAAKQKEKFTEVEFLKKIFRMTDDEWSEYKNSGEISEVDYIKFNEQREKFKSRQEGAWKVGRKPGAYSREDLDELEEKDLVDEMFEYEGSRDIPSPEDEDELLRILPYSGAPRGVRPDVEPIDDAAVDHYDALINMARELDTAEPEQISLDFGKRFADELGGGENTAAEVADLHQQVSTGQISPDGFRASLYKFAQKWHGKLLFGKPTKVLTKFSEDSEDATDLAAKARYDANKTYTSEAEKVGSDYNETFKEYAGGFNNILRQQMESLRPLLRGKAKKVVNLQLARSIRGLKSGIEAIDNAAATIRTDILNKIAADNDNFKLNPDVDFSNYFPRLWNRRALIKDYYGTKFTPLTPRGKQLRAGQGENKFAKLLVEDGQAADEAEAFKIIEEMLDKKNSIHSSGNSFFAKRKFDKIIDDNKYEDFLDNDIENVMYHYITQSAGSHAKFKVFGVRNIKEFEAKWIDGKDLTRPFEFDDNGMATQWRKIEGDEPSGIAAQVLAKGNKFDNKDREDILNLYKSMTGEDLKDYGPTAQYIRDGYVTAVRMAALPLSAVSSLTEILLNIQRVGLGASSKGFASALSQGTQLVTKNMADMLRINHNMTEPEIVSEMREFFMFVDNSAVSSADRLGDGAVASKAFRTINNVYFKVTLLDQWTKFVQLTSFNIGKSLIHKNLKAIADNGNLAPSPRIQKYMEQLDELNVDIDEGLEYIRRNNGEINKKDPFYYDVKRGAARYTGEIILDTSNRAAVKSAWLANPKTAMLGQLMGYPAAFTNVILKNFVRGMKNPEQAALTLSTALAMTTASTGLNYVRSRGEGYEDKSPLQIAAEGVARWGGNGIILDQMQRAAKTYEMTKGSEVVTALSLLGPIGQDVGTAAAYGNVMPIIGKKVPGYGAIKTIFGKEVKKDYDDFFKASKVRSHYEGGGKVEDKDKDKFKNYGTTGGVVEDVPRVPREPDERIDKMTGLPYDEQAGEAFEDVQDRERFAVGGIVSGLSRLITKAVTKKGLNIPQEKIDKVAADIEALPFINDPDVPNDPLMDEYITRQTQALLDEKHDKTIDELRNEMPEFFDERGVLQGGEEFSKARNYTTEEFENFTKANEIENEIGDLSDISNYIAYKLDTINARDPGFTAKQKFINYSTEMDKREAQTLFPEEIFYKEHLDNLLPSKEYEIRMNGLDSKEMSILANIFKDMPNITKRPNILGRQIPEREENLTRALEDSVEKKPQFRATKHGLDFEYEESSIMPFEIGLHVGSQGQARVMAIRGMNKYPDMTQASLKKSEDEITRELSSPDVDEFNPARPIAINKGYVFVKNPLVIETDLGFWSAVDILGENFNLNIFRKAIKEQNPSLDPKEVDDGFRKLIKEADDYIKWSQQDIGYDEKTLQLKDRLRLADLNIKLRNYIESLGFDSIKYYNKIDSPIEAKNKYSYMLFNPRQFKSTWASEFDLNDPRQNIRTGGLLNKLKERTGQRIVGMTENGKFYLTNYGSGSIPVEDAPDFMIKQWEKQAA